MPPLKRFLSLVAILLFLVFASIFIVGRSVVHRAETEMQARNYRAAAESYIRAARILFWRDDLWEQAAFAALQDEDISTAIYYFERADLSPRGSLSLAYAYYQIGDLDSAQHVFEQGATQYSFSSFYEGLALVYHAQKKWEEERNALQNQIRLDMGNARAHYRLGVLLTVLDSELALPEIMLAASLDPQFDSAAQTLRAALNLSVTQPDASRQMVTLGRALGLLEEWDLSILAFEKALALDSQNAEAWAWLGEAKQHRGEEGRADLDRAVNLDSKSPIVHALRGLYWNRQKKYAQALAAYELAAELDSQNPAWQASLGDAHVKMGDLVFALQSYQRATELAPNESEYWRLLAVFCVENGVDVEFIGLPAAQKSVALAPNDPLALDALGFVYYSTGRYANAEKILADVSARFPQFYAAQIHLALNHLAQGNRTAAYQILIDVRDADAGGADGLLAKRLLETYFP